jgi:hypothetical protein
VDPARSCGPKAPTWCARRSTVTSSPHYAICAFLCYAAEETGIDPDRVKFTNSFRIITDKIADPEAFPPDHQQRTRSELTTRIGDKRNLNPVRHREYPRVVKRARHNSYRVKTKGDRGTRHGGPASPHLVNHGFLNPSPAKQQVKALSDTS